MPALQIIALDTTTPQLRAPASGDTYSAPRAIELTPETLTGSSATSALAITQTWNTTGTPTAIDLNVTDTASNAASLLMNLRVGGTSQFRVTKAGSLFLANSGSNDIRGIYSTGYITGGEWRVGTTLWIHRDFAIQWDASGNPSSNITDLVLRRDAANTLAQRNGVNAQKFNIYNTYTDASNYEAGFVRWEGSSLQIGTGRQGTGAIRVLSLATDFTARWQVSAAGHFLAGLDNTYDIGASGATRPRSIYAASDIFCGGQMGPPAARLTSSGVGTTGYFGFAASNPLTPDTTLTRIAAGIIGVRDGTTGGAAVSLVEQTAPAAPATNGVYIYAEDNGAGKTRLMARFATGAAQQIAIEP